MQEECGVTGPSCLGGKHHTAAIDRRGVRKVHLMAAAVLRLLLYMLGLQPHGAGRNWRRWRLVWRRTNNLVQQG